MYQLNEATTSDLLSHFMSGLNLTGDRDMSSMHEELEEVKDSMINFVFAGRDTTGCTLSWFFYCMCSHQDKQEKVFQELMELENNRSCHTNQLHASILLSFNNYADLLTYETVHNRTPYLHASLAETLRLYPAVPRVNFLETFSIIMISLWSCS